MANEKELIKQIHDLIVKEYPEIEKPEYVPLVVKSGWYRLFRTDDDNSNIVSFYLDCTHSSLAGASNQSKFDLYGNKLIGIVYISQTGPETH